MKRLALSVAALAIIASGCGESDAGLDQDTLVVVVSSDLAIGRHRVAVGALDQQNESVVDPGTDVQFEFFQPDGTPAGQTGAEFIWAIEDVRGMWVADFEFDVAGAWRLGVRASADTFVVSPPFNVAEATVAIDVGQPAPPSESKTSSDATLGEITTDLSPDPSFYELTVAEAVTSGRPSVIVFATPAFCVSATCGPSLDVAKDVAAGHGDAVNFVHVEVFENLDAQTREELVVAEPVLEWGLQTEPWVYVVDEAGIVSARFEGAIGEAELRAAVSAVR